MTIDALLSRLDGVRKTSADRWLAKPRRQPGGLPSRGGAVAVMEV